MKKILIRWISNNWISLATLQKCCEEKPELSNLLEERALFNTWFFLKRETDYNRVIKTFCSFPLAKRRMILAECIEEERKRVETPDPGFFYALINFLKLANHRLLRQ